MTSTETALKAPARHCTNRQKMEATLTSGRQADSSPGTARTEATQGCVPNTQVTPINQEVRALYRARPTEQGVHKAGSNCTAYMLGNSPPS